MFNLMFVLLDLIFQSSHLILKSKLISVICKGNLDLIILAHYTAGIKSVELGISTATAHSTASLALEAPGEAEISQLEDLPSESFVLLV
jgi:hypothetical protein